MFYFPFLYLFEACLIDSLAWGQAFLCQGGETTKIDDAADVDVGPSDVVEPGDNEEYITEVLVA